MMKGIKSRSGNRITTTIDTIITTTNRRSRASRTGKTRIGGRHHGGVR